jgi:hypothetical protein
VGGAIKKLEKSGLIEIDKKTEFGKSNSYFVFPEQESVYHFIDFDLNNFSVPNFIKRSSLYENVNSDYEQDKALFAKFGIEHHKPFDSTPDSLGTVTKTTSPLTPTGVSTKSEVKPPRKPLRSSPKKKKKKKKR